MFSFFFYVAASHSYILCMSCIFYREDVLTGIYLVSFHVESDTEVKMKRFMVINDRCATGL